MSISKLVTACLFLMFQGSAVFAQEINTVEERRMLNVARIFMHTPTPFSLLVPVGEVEWGLVDASNCAAKRRCDEVVFLMDVPADKPMWYRAFRFQKHGNWFYTDRAEFHIRTPADIEGGGWSRRSGKKTIYGTTNVIQ